MNIFYIEWTSLCNEDMIRAFGETGHRVTRIPYDRANQSLEVAWKLLEDGLKQAACDFVFSFNYFPEISNCCKELNLNYVSWVYDNPHIQVYSYTVLNPCNYIFLFDYVMYEEFRRSGINTVYYLPLAVDGGRMSELDGDRRYEGKYTADISFVGSLYSEKKHRIYDKFQDINQYTKGYLDGLIQAQKNVQGYNFIQQMLSPEIVAEMQKAYPTDPNASTVLTPEAIYADYVLNRQVTALERWEILQLLGEHEQVMLYTHDKEVEIPGVTNRGPVDYYDGMPYVFRQSKINLNITLRSIKSGIPLRALDIMGNGGFLLTNYQEEMFAYFEPDKDFVYYSNYEELLEKVAYYLEHDEEREQIARNGCAKVRSGHNFKRRIEYILDILTGDEHETTSV